jgi:hypothetical protein
MKEIDVLYYIIGVIITFILVTVQAYYTLRKKYVVTPTIQGIWNTIVQEETAGRRALAIIFFPFTIIYCVLLLVGTAFNLLLLGFSKLINKS